MKKRISTIISLVFILQLLLTGCGTKDPASPQNPSSSGTSPNTSQSILRYTMVSVPKIDPGVGADAAGATIFVNVYDPLITPTHDGSVAPWIATDWTVSDDSLVWTFHLRDDVTFHSGNRLTAKDVAYTMNRMLALGEGFGYLFSSVQEAVVVDDYTVQFICREVSGTLEAALIRLYILDSALVEANYQDGTYGEFGDYGKAFLLENDAGSGPYKIKEFLPNTHVYCEQFPEYWAGFGEHNPKEFKLIGSNEAVTVRAMMQNKELEIADKYQTYETTEAMAAMDGIEVMSYVLGSELYLTLNNQKAPTDDVHIRRALAYMVDYDAITQSVFPDSVKADSVVPSTLFGYSKMHDFSYNIEKAKEEIAQSKYADNIQNYPIDISWVAETPDREKLALIIQASASQVGLNVNIVKTPWTSVVEGAATIEGTPHATTTLWSADYPEAGSYFSACVRSRDVGTWANSLWIKDATLDSMIDDSLLTIDTAQREQKYKDIQAYMADICAAVPIMIEAERSAYQASYVEWNAAEQDQLIPVMGYPFYMRNINLYPDKR